MSTKQWRCSFCGALNDEEVGACSRCKTVMKKRKAGTASDNAFAIVITAVFVGLLAAVVANIVASGWGILIGPVVGLLFLVFALIRLAYLRKSR